MSDVTAFEQAAGQAGQTAGAALQALILMAKAVSEHQERRAAAIQQQQPAQVQQQPTADPQLERLAQAVREKIQPPEVAAAMVAGPGWPQLASELQRLERSGVDVRTFLADAAPLVQRIDADLKAQAPQPGVSVPPAALAPRDPWAPPPNERGRNRPDRPSVGRRMWEGVKKTGAGIRERWQKWRERRSPSALGKRSKALAAEGIGPQMNARFVVIARESVADERLLGSLVTSRQWPAIAGQMNRLQEAGKNPREALAGVPARIKQAEAAGVRITAAEAARGLLSEAARTPAPTAAAPVTPTAAPTAAAPVTPTPAPTAPSITPAAGAAPATHREVAYRWEITYPDENSLSTVARGEAIVPAGPGERAAVEAVAAQQLANAARTMPQVDPRRQGYVFSAVGPGGSAQAVHMQGNHPKAQAAIPEPKAPAAGTAQAQARAAAANARSTTAPNAAPGRSPAAAMPSPTTKAPAPAPAHRPNR